LEQGKHIWNLKVPYLKLELKEFHREIVDVCCTAHTVHGCLQMSCWLTETLWWILAIYAVSVIQWKVLRDVIIVQFKKLLQHGTKFLSLLHAKGTIFEVF
jgi:hypothetical protein